MSSSVFSVLKIPLTQFSVKNDDVLFILNNIYIHIYLTTISSNR